MKLDSSPVPIKNFTKQKNEKSESNGEAPERGFMEPERKTKFYEIWKVFLEENEDEISVAYVALSADFFAKKYKNGKFTNVKFRGFYTTLQEAKNEIDGYLR